MKAADTDSEASDGTTGNGSAARADPGFIKVPLHVLHDSRLLPMSKLILGRLMLFAGRNGECYPSHMTIGHEVCTPGRHVKRCLEQLRKYGYVSWTRTSRGNLYRLTDRPCTSYQEPESDRTCASYQEPERWDPQVPSDRTYRSPEVGPVGPTNRCPEKKLLKEPPPPKSLDSTQAGRASEAPGGGGGGDSSNEDEQRPDEQHASDAVAFAHVEDATAAKLDGGLRAKIRDALQSQGFAPAHLAAWSSRERFEHSTNKVGLLITMAREFATRSEGFAFGCLRCFGDGLADGKPCTCPEGVKEAAIIDLKAKRAKADLEAKQAEDAKKAHDKPFMDRSICPKCEGAAGGCKSCNGTGVWRSTDAWRALGLCWMCSGTGRMGSRPCICCKGSGKNPRAFDSNGTAVGAELREA